MTRVRQTMPAPSTHEAVTVVAAEAACDPGSTMITARMEPTSRRAQVAPTLSRRGRAATAAIGGIAADQPSVDRNVDVVDVIGGVTAAVSHVAPALSVPLDVPDVLVPDHVVDAEPPGIGLRPFRDLVAERLASCRGVVRNHQIQRTTAWMVGERVRPYAVVGRDLRKGHHGRPMDLDRVRNEALLHGITAAGKHRHDR